MFLLIQKIIKNHILHYFLEAQLLFNYNNVTDSHRHLLTLLTGRFALLKISPLLWTDLDFYGFTNLEFNKEAFSDGFMAYSRVFREVLNFK